MTEHRVIESEGWAGIAAALARAVSGDTVLIGRGRYAGAETISLGSGVTLAAEPEALLDYRGDTTAIAARDATGITIRGVTLQGYAGLADMPDDASESDEERMVGLIRLDQVAGASIENCNIRALAKRRSCIAAISSDAVIIERSTVSGAWGGISFFGTQGKISRNNCSGNGLSGIALSRNSVDLTRISSAKINNNRCHDNRLASIVLVSSRGWLTGNECFASGNGIVLTVEPICGDPSSAEIENNRCYNNRSDGISLSSSTGRLNGNECFGNDSNGISLSRQRELPDQPSSAEIENNRCHDNRQAGLVLLSSKGRLTINECFGNRCGIVLQAGRYSLDKPSSSTMINNHCHDNHEAGILLSSSTGRLHGNECFDNLDGIAFQHQTGATDADDRESRVIGNLLVGNQRRGLSLLQPIGSVSGNSIGGNGADAPSITARKLVEDGNLLGAFPIPSLAPLAAKLGDGPDRVVEARAGFLLHGCAGCFERSWPRRTALKPASSDNDGETEAATGSYRIVLAEKAGDVSATAKRGSPDTAEALGRLRERCYDRTGPGRKKPDPVVFVALVNPDDVEIKRAADARPSIAREDATRRVAPALLVPARSPDARSGTGNDLARRIEEAVLAGRSRALQRLLAIVAHPLSWFVVALLAVTAVFHKKLGIDEEALKALKPFMHPESLLGLLIALAGALGLLTVATSTVAVLDALIFPPSLRILKEDTNKPLAMLDRFAHRLGRGRSAGDAWRRLMRRHLLAANAVIPIFLHAVEELTEADLATLEEVAGACPPESTMMIVFQLDDRSLVRPLFLDAMAGKPWRHGLELVLDDDRGRFALTDVPEATAEARIAVAAAILGLEIDDPNGHDELFGNFNNEMFSLLDLIPTFAIASVPGARFNLNIPRLRDMDPALEAIDAKATGYSALLQAKPSRSIDAMKLEALRACLKKAKDVASVLTVSSKGTRSDQFIGRVGERRATAALLLAVIPQRTDAVTYIAGAIACGLSDGLDGTAELLKAAEAANDRERKLPLLRRATRGMTALALLGDDLASVLKEHDDGGTARMTLAALLSPGWQRLEARIAEPVGLAAAFPEAAAAFYAAFVSARHRSLALTDLVHADRFAARLVEEVVSGPDVVSTLRDGFTATYSRLLRKLAYMEPELATTTLRRLFRRDWPTIPTALRDRLEGAAEHGRSLATLIASAASLAELATIIALHEGSSRRLGFILGALSSVTNDTPADAVKAVRDKLALISSWPSIGRDEVADSDKHDVARLRRQAHAVAEFMTSEVPISASSRRPSSIDGEVLSLDRIFDRELDRTLANMPR